MTSIPTLLLHRVAISLGVSVDAVNESIVSGDSQEVTVDSSHQIVSQLRERGAALGLGDAVALLFHSVGATRDRAQAVAHAFGFDDCGCEHRQEALNRFGRDWLGMRVASDMQSRATPAR